MQIYGTKVNHLRNPLGFRMERTVFSWKVKQAKGTEQKAARIRIAADERMEQLLFDSGWDPEADPLAYPVPLDLSERTRYFWQVQVQSNAPESVRSPGPGNGSPVTARRRDIRSLRRRSVRQRGKS